MKPVTKKPESSDSDDSSDESSSDEKMADKKSKESSDDSDDSSESSEEAKPAKKSKKTKSQSPKKQAPVTPKQTPPPSTQTTPTNRTPRGQKSPFKRVDDSYAAGWSQFGNNSFNNKVGDEYGKKANEILSRVRGKDFRHEKTKKKRAYRSSGPISNDVNSFKFDDSD